MTDTRVNHKPNMHMSTLATKANWNIAKGKLKQTLARLTGDDLHYLEGKVDELVGRIQKNACVHGKKLAARPATSPVAALSTDQA